MTNYLAPILRDQFNKFYRYGYTYIPASQILVFEGKITDEEKDKIIELFKSISPFEYDEDYLILHLDKSERDSASNIRFDIQNIVSVYPLSKQAKVSVENKIDQRIKLEQPIFENTLSIIEANIQRQEIERAIDALWLICNLEGGYIELLQSIGLKNIFQGIEFRKSGTKANKIKGNNYWTYLIAYDRFDFFPNSTLGFFYDAGQVFAYSKNFPTFEGSGLHKFLQKINSDNPDIKFKEVIALLESEVQVKSYISQTTDNKIKQYFVAPIYLMLKDELRNSDEISLTKLIKNEDFLDFDENFKAAVILLGAFFGYKKFYDTYYDKLDLRFYKSFKQESKPQKKVEEEKQQQEICNEPILEKVEATVLKVSESVIENDNTSEYFEEIILSILKENGNECKSRKLTSEFKKRNKKQNDNIDPLDILKNMEGRVEPKYNKAGKIESIRLKIDNNKVEVTQLDIPF